MVRNTIRNRSTRKKAIGCQIEETNRPEYIKEYLEEAMRKNRNMRGFKSLRALYLFEKGEQLEEKAKKVKNIYDESAYSVFVDTNRKEREYERLMQRACFLRCEADMAEDEYIELQNQEKLIKHKKIG